MALSDLTALKIALGIAASNTSRDNVLEQALNAADRAIKSYCKRALEYASYTWYLNGSGMPELVLPQRPVVSITSVNLDSRGFFGRGVDAFASDTLLTEGVDYVLKYDDPEGGRSQSGILLRISGGAHPNDSYFWPAQQPQGTLTARVSPYWPRGIGNVKILAVAGYQTVPEDLAAACHMLAVWLWKNIPRGGVPLGSERFEEYGYSLAVNALRTGTGGPEIGTIRGLLAPYKERSL